MDTSLPSTRRIPRGALHSIPLPAPWGVDPHPVPPEARIYVARRPGGASDPTLVRISVMADGRIMVSPSTYHLGLTLEQMVWSEQVVSQWLAWHRHELAVVAQGAS